LYSKIAGIEKQVGVNEFGNPIIDIAKSFFVEKPQSYSQLSQRLENIIIGLTEERGQLIDFVNTILIRMFNTSIKTDDSIVNETPPLSFKLNKRQVISITSKIELDMELYAKMKERPLRQNA
jgi:hypothetical protein